MKPRKTSKHFIYMPICRKAVTIVLLWSMLAGILAGCGNNHVQEQELRAAADSPAGEAVPANVSEPALPSASSRPEDVHGTALAFTAESPEDFYAATIPAFLADADGENRIYSPANVYIALAMLAELTGGESRRQLLALLGTEDIDALRSYVSGLLSDNSRDDDISTILPAASLWADRELQLQKDSVGILSRTYHATTHQGEMGSDELNREFQEWLDDQTGGLLQQQAARQQFSDNTLLALASTLYFKNSWEQEFPKNATVSDTFYADTGDMVCDFMHQTLATVYYRGDAFAAVALPFADGCKLWLLLPDEDSSADELLQRSSDWIRLLMHSSESDNTQYLTVHLSVPKFDVISDMDLADNLRQSGITDVFDQDVADFSAILTDEAPAAVSRISHAARVKIDEEGCEAAAFTVVVLGCDRFITEETDFIANRPFVFVITGNGEVPLFTGVVNRP